MAAWRKTTEADPAVLETTPEADPLLRNESDPDPLIEEMVARLRDGLSSLVAVDEWGRPLAWRNVVRLALGPLASRLRDTEQALEIAVSMIPPTAEEPVAEIAFVEAAPVEVFETPAAPEAALETPAIPEAALETVDAPIEAVAHVLASDAPVAVPSIEDHAAEAPVHDPDAPIAEEVSASVQPTVDVILPAADAMSDQPVEMAQPSGVPAVRSPGATSLFTISGDQRPVAVSPLSSSEFLRGSGTDDTTSAKYDRFLTGLYGERKQVRGDEDRGTGGAGLGDDL